MENGEYPSFPQAGIQSKKPSSGRHFGQRMLQKMSNRFAVFVAA